MKREEILSLAWETAGNPEFWDDDDIVEFAETVARRAALAEQPREPEMRRCPRCWEPMLVPVSAEQEVEQEPVAWLSWTDGEGYGYWATRSEAELNCSGDAKPVPLYTAPARREWQGLTDEEIAEIHRTCKYDASPWPLSRAIEATLKEKNND